MTKPLRIGLVRKGNSSWMGGQEYMKNLVLAARAASRAQGMGIEMSLLVPESDDSSLAEGITRHVGVPSDLPPRRFGRMRSWLEGASGDRPLDHVVRKERFDFVYPVDALSARVPSRRAAWIPDLQHRVMPGYCSEGELRDREAWIRSMMDSARTLVFSSEASREDFRAAYDPAGHALEVLRFRISLPADLLDGDPGEVTRKHGLPPVFFLVSNQFWAHKNHLTLLEAMARAKSVYPDLVVAMTGAPEDYRNPEYPRKVIDRIEALGLQSNARLLGLIPKAEQLQLLRACRAVIQPSLFEGWNTVVEESRCLGKEIILSDLPVHREQQPPHVRYFPGADAGALADCIVEFLSRPAESVDERAAVAEYEQLFLRFGERFLEIVREAGMAGRA
jgi:glycosyltransferase involved in cell wall biosynthesis